MYPLGGDVNPLGGRVWRLDPRLPLFDPSGNIHRATPATAFFSVRSFPAPGSHGQIQFRIHGA
eukprot:8408592-Pyramimonas_sp.AAC.1